MNPGDQAIIVSRALTKKQEDAIDHILPTIYGKYIEDGALDVLIAHTTPEFASWVSDQMGGDFLLSPRGQQLSNYLKNTYLKTDRDMAYWQLNDAGNSRITAVAARTQAVPLHTSRAPADNTQASRAATSRQNAPRR